LSQSLPSPRPLLAWPPALLVDALVQAGVRRTQALPAVKALCARVHREDLPQDQALAQVPATVAAPLASLLLLERSLTQVEDAASQDRTRRLLLRTDDGEVIESVIIPATKGDRTTLCVSSQVGCGRRCAFCETGRLGLTRQLTPDEIVLQFRHARDLWSRERGSLPPITNVVFMGMGEPLDNLDAVAAAIAVLTHDFAYGLSPRRVTVSTVGVAPKIAAFFQQTQADLAVSLNAPDDARRSLVMPINQRCGLQDLKLALLDALPPRRHVLVEYILFAGFNDAPEDADLLLAWLAGLPVRLNLIPANPGPDPALKQPTTQAVLAFQKRMLEAGVRAMVRWPHGRDVGGACGQLAGQHRHKLSLEAHV
jgi:23S rRNA (adenine2503-C2)-methyltransferase